MFILGKASPTLSCNAPHQLYARLSGTLDPTTKEGTMSSVYATEPATSARVIFETTHGPLDIKLWCRECPATTKLFLQLCLDGFYDGLLFHRIVPSLLIQTGALRRRGDATTTATMPSGGGGGNSMEKYRQEVQAEEALERRAFELNPRIRFNHRGQVAMALEVDGITDAKDMQPQFFITTESAPYLDRKHVIFGTLGSGSPTVFNAIRISGVAVDEGTNQPVELDQAPRITSTKIVESEIHTDLVPKSIVPWRPAKLSGDDDKKENKKSKRKGKFDTNVLSFGDEVADLAPLVKRPKSQKKQDERAVEQQESADPTTREHDDWASEAVSGKADTAPEMSVVPGPSQASTDTVKSSGRPERSVAPASHAEDANSEPIVSVIEQRRARFTKKKTNKQQREDETLAKLMKFRGKLKESVLASSGPPLSSSNNDQDNSLAARMARQAESSKGQSSRTDHVTEAYQGQILHSDNNEEDTGSAWLQTRFKCKRHMDYAAGEKDDEYEVIDEKGKSRDRDRRKK
jgi:peptidyl-prolyl cis-trans isomerase SDCCAG10